MSVLRYKFTDVDDRTRVVLLTAIVNRIEIIPLVVNQTVITCYVVISLRGKLERARRYIRAVRDDESRVLFTE